ncbi:hypothetical protein SAMN02745702_01616 [Desulfobaculum bizertense DSM 18034]|uniref:Uncharacterized protein n=1 Tax=Desulfobaculum bizertense DSM 18034 TaxID=1121442 RepID=A0A1T4W4L6_9BACT|nr:hypothetical protein SAMN02745702_01616 [Desulfobaculum bizertense DSM 18034]
MSFSTTFQKKLPEFLAERAGPHCFAPVKQATNVRPELTRQHRVHQHDAQNVGTSL